MWLAYWLALHSGSIIIFFLNVKYIYEEYRKYIKYPEFGCKDVLNDIEFGGEARLNIIGSNSKAKPNSIGFDGQEVQKLLGLAGQADPMLLGSAGPNTSFLLFYHQHHLKVALQSFL
jgi:hypothetical protein